VEVLHGSPSPFRGLRERSRQGGEVLRDRLRPKRIDREDLEIGSAIYMSDGVINLALLNFTGAAGSKASDLKDPKGHVGAHHFGFQVDDLAETQKRIEANGGKFFFDLGDERHGNFERKFKDPDGVIFDVSTGGWQGTDSYKK
jgi:catechol 2,3-dioxygenase-like lactoylglutathione lyase family enzyme